MYRHALARPLFLAREVREAAPEYGNPGGAADDLGIPDTDRDRADAAEETPSGLGSARDAPSEADPAQDASDEADAPEAPSDADALDDLGHEIATLAAHIHAATARLLEMLAEFDRRGGWKAGGHRSCAHWLAFRTGIDLGAAREKVRAARALVDLPRTSAAMARGELSFSKVRALTRIATPETEGDLLDLARGATTAQVERMVRAWKRGSAKDEAEWERTLYESRRLSIFPDDDGMYVVKGRLTAEVGALVMRAIEAASDALYREERARAEAATEPEAAKGPGSPGARSTVRDRVAAYGQASNDRDARREAARRRADALGLLAERGMGAGFGADAPVSGSRAERYQVVLHVSAETLSGEERGGNGGGDVTGDGDLGGSDVGNGGDVGSGGDAAGGGGLQVDHPHADYFHPLAPDRSHLDDGTRVSAETSRRLSCDAAVVAMAHDRDGRILDVGRRTRSIPPALRRALDARDRGCRFPGCGSRFTDAHHVKHWADGGETSLGNCVLLCRYHHRLVHEEGWKVEWWGEGRPAFFGPQGQMQYDGRWVAPGGLDSLDAPDPPDASEGPPASALPENPAAPLVTANRARGIDPDGYAASARWKTEAAIPDDIYFRALEATA